MPSAFDNIPQNTTQSVDSYLAGTSVPQVTVPSVGANTLPTLPITNQATSFGLPNTTNPLSVGTLSNQIPTARGNTALTPALDPMSIQGLEARKIAALEQQVANTTPTAMDTIGTGLTAANTAFGIYDQIWGQAGEYKDAQIQALKQNIGVTEQEATAKSDFRSNVASAFA